MPSFLNRPTLQKCVLWSDYVFCHDMVVDKYRSNVLTRRWNNRTCHYQNDSDLSQNRASEAHISALVYLNGRVMYLKVCITPRTGWMVKYQALFLFCLFGCSICSTRTLFLHPTFATSTISIWMNTTCMRWRYMAGYMMRIIFSAATTQVRIFIDETPFLQFSIAVSLHFVSPLSLVSSVDIFHVSVLDNLND